LKFEAAGKDRSKLVLCPQYAL